MKATPRPLFRWKSFWLGILVLVFLGWAWANSLSTAREAYFYRQGFFLWHGDSRFVIHTFARSGWMPSDESGIGFHDYRLEPSKQLCVPPVSVADEFGMHTVHVPHWLLILLFLIPWVGFLAWRVRKQRKLAFS